MTKRSPKPQGKCIFCGRTGLSKEHVWSDWLTDEIKMYKSHGEAVELHEVNLKTNILSVEPKPFKSRPGNPLQRKVRNVCRVHCNNGWMGRAVAAAKPTATKLIRGAVCYLEPDERTKLATWLAISTIMQEFRWSGTVTIPPEHRTALMENNTPPASWRMWIGHYDGRRHYPCSGACVPGSARLTKDPEGTIDYKTVKFQITTMTLRHLLVHVFAGDDDFIVNHYSKTIAKYGWPLGQLWPVTGGQVMWPIDSVPDGVVDYLSNGHGVADLRVGPRASADPEQREKELGEWLKGLRQANGNANS